MGGRAGITGRTMTAMGLTRDMIREALEGVLAPGQLRWCAACDAYASAKIALPEGTAREEFERVAGAAQRAAAAKARGAGLALDSLVIEFVGAGERVIHTARFGAAGGTSEPPREPARVTPEAKAPGAGALPGIAHAIAVGAGKGGVGKSTVALNIAVGLARRGRAVGLLDGDIYGPSMPTMLGLGGMEPLARDGMLQPFVAHGIKCVTMGKLVEPDKPLIWRGPMAHGAFKQLAEQTRWGELDDLVIDLPPGTGDVALTMSQVLRLTGAVVVCTPQKVAQDDAARATRMFQQLKIDVLGVVENMSYFIGDDGKEYDLFGRGGAEGMARRLGVPFLGSIPITIALRVNSDRGDPTANFTGGDRAGEALRRALEGVIDRLEAEVSLAGVRQGLARPTLNIS